MEESVFDALGKLVLRLTLGVLILFHGIAKILNPAPVEFIGTRLAEMGIPPEVAYGVYAGEVLAPLMIILGLFSRIGGLIVVVNMVFAVVLMHAGDLISVTEHGGWALELQACYLFCGLAVLLLGSGKFAVKPD